MKNLKALFLLPLLLLGTPAHAEESEAARPLFECALDFQMKGGGVQVLVGYFKMKGPGELRCSDVNGHESHYPVDVEMGGTPIALRVAAGYFELRGLASGIGVTRSPHDIFGSYAALDANAAVLAGAGAKIAFHDTRKAINLDVALAVEGGIGVDLAIDQLNIIPVRRR
jgi:Protein of unknown function (DUF992)